MTSYEFWTLAIAAMAFVLSIGSTLRDHFRDRVKLKLRFSHGFLVTALGRREVMQFTVVNLSSIPLYVDEVGFVSRTGPARWFVVPTNASGDFISPWPAKLEPRQSMAIFAAASEAVKFVGDAGRCRARTSCGAEFYGNRFHPAKGRHDRAV